MTEYRLFTSESVSEGHPDKLADQISDTVLDLFLEHDPQARCAIETLVKTGFVLLAGEVRSRFRPELDAVLEQRVRSTIVDIGYNNSEVGFDGNTCGILNALGQQSADIAQGVDRGDEAQGAGDQGMMFGYASDETPELMPAPIILAHRLVRRQAQLRHEGKLPWLRPDAKSQVTVRYDKGQLSAVDTVVLSTQHSPDIGRDELYEAVMEEIVKPVLGELLSPEVVFHINPTGLFELGGPVADCGLTGRKIIVDTYGGMARHGGGAFSGKDPSKVDRSAAYAARYVAKNIVAAGLARRCEVQLSYAIGYAQPVSVTANSFGTGDDQRLDSLITESGIFDLTPEGIATMLDLRRPIYRATASYGHFGRAEPEFSWERTDRADALREAMGLVPGFPPK